MARRKSNEERNAEYINEVVKMEKGNDFFSCLLMMWAKQNTLLVDLTASVARLADALEEYKEGDKGGRTD